MTRIRKAADERKTELLTAAHAIAAKDGIKAVTRAAVARKCKVSDGLLNRYFESREGLRLAVMEHAVELKDAPTLAAAGEIYELPAMSQSLAREVLKLAS